jgi:anaerobic ribonucleoside-triphosphate reductase activating protein
METIPTDLNLDYFDYIKVGPYKKDLGGLRNPNTNQKLYKKDKNGRWENITYRFWK